MSVPRSDHDGSVDREEMMEGSPDLNEEELLMGGEEDEEEGVMPRGDSAGDEGDGEDSPLDELSHIDRESPDDEPPMEEDNFDAEEEDGPPLLDDDDEDEEERRKLFGVADDDHDIKHEVDDEDEDEDLSPLSSDSRRSSRLSSRSTRQSASIDQEDGLLLDDDERQHYINEYGEEEEEEEERVYDDDKKRGKDDAHPTLLAPHGEGIIHVGSEYQATIQEGRERTAREDEDRDVALWLPPPGGLNEDELVEFCEEAMGIYMLSFDRALYILQSSGYDYKKALETVSQRKSVREEWSEDDNVLFRQAYALYGKNFARIRQTMPHRSMSSIIHHYYSTKKQQDYKSLVDSKIDRTGFHIEEENSGAIFIDGGKCENCEERVDRLFLIESTKQCNTCTLYFKLMLKPRPLPKEELSEGRSKRRGLTLDKDYMEIVDDFIALAEHLPEPTGEPAPKRTRHDGIHMSVCVFQSKKTKVHEKMRELEHEMLRCRTRTVRTEQAIKAQRAQLAERANFDRLRQQIDKKDDDKGRVRMQYTWTDQEKITAFHCFVRYGRDFEAVAEVVGTKSPDMVKSLYSELKDDIDKIIDDAEEEDEKQGESLDREAVLGTKKLAVEVVDLD